MSEDLIKAEPRTEFGKGAARRIRRTDKVPAVIYGHGNDPIHVTLPGHDTMLALKHGGTNAVLNIEIDGKVQLALTKQVQADPIKGYLEHIDFVAVRKGEKVTVEVPVHLVGEAAPETFVQLENNVVTLEAEATHIPENIEVSIEGAEVGTQITAAQLDAAPGLFPDQRRRAADRQRDPGRDRRGAGGRAGRGRGGGGHRARGGAGRGRGRRGCDRGGSGGGCCRGVRRVGVSPWGSSGVGGPIGPR